MEDRTFLTNNHPTDGISDTFRQFIEALVEEVVINGEPFDAQKKWLRKNSENEGVDYTALEKGLLNLFEAFKELKNHKSNSLVLLAKMLAKDCYISDEMLDKLVSAMDKTSEGAEHNTEEETEREAPEVNCLDVDEDGNVFCTDKNIQGELSIPSTLKGKRVSGIKENAFRDCKNLTGIVIPDSMTEIGHGAFSDCVSLNSIVIPNSVTKIGEAAFSKCIALANPLYNAHCFAYFPKNSATKYRIPDGIKQIAGWAFWGCENLTGIVIPNSVTEIGRGAFCECKGLTSIVIPNSVTKIEEEVFEDCTGLSSIEIPNSVTKIGEKAFWSCESLISIEIPNSVMEIGEEAFWSCESLTSIVIPNSVTKIGYAAFEYCKSLNSVVIPNSVTEVDFLFFGCDSLKSAKLPKRLIEAVLLPQNTEVEYY